MHHALRRLCILWRDLAALGTMAQRVGRWYGPLDLSTSCRHVTWAVESTDDCGNALR